MRARIRQLGAGRTYAIGCTRHAACAGTACSPGLAPRAGRACGARQGGDGHRALAWSYTPGIAGPFIHALTGSVRPRVARSGWTRFPTPGHLVFWVALSPRTLRSGPENRSGKTGKGNGYLRGMPGEAAAAAGARIPSSASVTGRSSSAAANSRPWSPAPSWSSSGTCSPAAPAASTTSASAAAPAASTRAARPATTSVSLMRAGSASPLACAA